MIAAFLESEPVRLFDARAPPKADTAQGRGGVIPGQFHAATGIGALHAAPRNCDRG